MSDRSVSRRQQEKRWYTVLAPEQFERAELGDTPAREPEQLYDRKIQTTLGDIREESGGENNVTLTFQIDDVGSDAAYTKFIKHELARDYLRSLVRRGSSKVETVQVVRTTDDYRVEVQPVAFTTKQADHSQKKAIRRIMIDQVADAAEEHTMEGLVDAVVEGRLSSSIYSEAKTIYPLRRVEVQKTVVEAAPEEVQEEEETAVDVDDEDVEV
jgi:small subunit ribosomal protein S3Ae